MKEGKASYKCSQARIRKDRERFFFGFCDFMNFFLVFLGVYFCSTLLENNRFCFVPFLVPIQYITYPVLTSMNFYPLFKRRDTAIFNSSTYYHVFILGMKYYPNSAKNIPYGTVHWIYPYLIQHLLHYGINGTHYLRYS